MLVLTATIEPAPFDLYKILHVAKTHPKDKEERSKADGLLLKKEKIAKSLAKLKKRTLKYDKLQQQLDSTTEKQISRTSPESRTIILVKKYKEVPYNAQNAEDD